MPGRRRDRCGNRLPGATAIGRAQRETEQGRQISIPCIAASEEDSRLRPGQIDPVPVNGRIDFSLTDKGAPRLNRRAFVENNDIVGAVPGGAIVKAARQNDLGAPMVPTIAMLNIAAVAVGTGCAVVNDGDLAAAEIEDTALAGVAGIAIRARSLQACVQPRPVRAPEYLVWSLDFAGWQRNVQINLSTSGR